MFVNGAKIPLIPELFVGNQLVTDFFEKSNLFNNKCSQKCRAVVKNCCSYKSNLQNWKYAPHLNSVQAILFKPLGANKAHEL